MATPDPIKIDSDRLLLCEGKATLLVLGPLCRHFEIRGFQPIDFGSKDNFRKFMEDVTLLPGFASRVQTVGIVRDAETSSAAAFTAVREALAALSIPAPSAPGEIVAGPPRVGVFILPDNTGDGMIETLCVRSVEEDPAFACLNIFFECVRERLGSLPSNIHKARAQAFLATRREVEYHVGRAADRGVWNFRHDVFEPLVTFLRGLAA